MTDAIGGYFGFNAGHANETFLDDGIMLNSGRSAFAYILLTRQFTKMYIPYYTCEVLMEPLRKNNVEFEYYHIDNMLEPIFDWDNIKDGEGFLYTNYFGLKDNYIQSLPTHSKCFIIDNAQSIFSTPLRAFDTFYSPRKFFGLPDGGVAFTGNRAYYEKLERDISVDRFSHLLKRTDISAEAGYNDFQINDMSISDAAVMKMSNCTRLMLAAQDMDHAQAVRSENFSYLHNALRHTNKVQYIESYSGPMVFPYWPEKEGLKQKLLEQRVFCPTYWPNVMEIVPTGTFEYELASKCIFLPIDQRYGKNEMDKILEVIL